MAGSGLLSGNRPDVLFLSAYPQSLLSFWEGTAIVALIGGFGH